jgi:multiple sugar transport system permease protein
MSAQSEVPILASPEAAEAARSTITRRAGGPPLSPQRKSAARRENIAGYGFLVPWLIGFFGLTVGPMAISLYLAFTSYNLFTSPRFIGFDNFTRMFTDDPNFTQSVTITLIYVVIGTPITT